MCESTQSAPVYAKISGVYAGLIIRHSLAFGRESTVTTVYGPGGLREVLRKSNR